ncbi:MAG: hypothetical protein QM530_04340 [Phycisphaerales bacterium]|nr:hypothetical protein [Phycisphaerales bacterium]
MQKLVQYKFSLIVSVILLTLPFGGSFILSFKIWDRLAIIFPMFVLFYGDSFPFSILISLFITLPIYSIEILGLFTFILSKGKYRSLLKAMLLGYMTFFVFLGAIILESLIGVYYIHKTSAINFVSTLSILSIILWGVISFKAAVKLD